MPLSGTGSGLIGHIALLMAGVALASSAAAQGAPPAKWEIEMHAGSASMTNPAGGTSVLPPPGETFTTSNIFPPPNPRVPVVSSSRRVSSWYFGDGALIFNQAAASVASNPLAMTAPFSGRIVPLDPVLGWSLAGWDRGFSFGARVTRMLTPRLGAELSVDYSPASIEATRINIDHLEATRASFIDAFSGLIRSNPNRVLRSVTSEAELHAGDAHQLATSGALLINLLTDRRLVPYAVLGASLISITGTPPSVVLRGNYQFLNPSGSAIDETDTVTVRDARKRRTGAGVLGGGVRFHTTARWGIRVDARVALMRNAARTTIDAKPEAALGSLPAGRGTLNAEPTLQFSNDWTNPVTALGVTAVGISTLSGPSLTGFQTLTGTGVASHLNISAGLFFRF
jgi:hypothetical protein